MNEKLAVITGASSGIGAALAKRLAREGMPVILVARRSAELASLTSGIQQQGGRASFVSADLSDEGERSRVFTEIMASHGLVDVLINNAGLGWYGYYDQMPWKTAREMLRVNVEAVIHLSLLFLQSMKSRGSGHIINIGSISGSLPSQGIALYGATKSFLDNFTTALQRELSGSRVHASVVRSGSVMTNFYQSAAQRENGLHLPTEHIGISAEVVAERIMGLIHHPRRVIYIPSILRIVPALELAFGWLIDAIGPFLLRKNGNYSKS